MTKGHKSLFAKLKWNFCTTNYSEKSEKNSHDWDIFFNKVKLDLFCHNVVEVRGPGNFSFSKVERDKVRTTTLQDNCIFKIQSSGSSRIKSFKNQPLL